MANLGALCVLTMIVAAMAGCSRGHDDSSESAPGVLCPLNLRFVPGIVVEVRDMLTNDPIASNAVGTLQYGGYQETMQPYKAPQDTALLSLQGAIERPGTYDVLVQEPGYKDWSMPHVTVLFAGCDVVTVYLEADLMKTN
jgi:hypothetical protein